MRWSRVGLVCLVLFLCFLSASSYRTKSPNKRGLDIVGGTKASPHQFPFVCWLHVGRIRCGATLIEGGRYLLTAAHCFDSFPRSDTNANLNLVSCYAGGNSLDGIFTSEYQPGIGQVRYASAYRIHSKYLIEDEQVKYDVAVIKLSKPFNLDDTVSAISIASELPTPGTMCYIVGWGFTKDEGSLSNDLLYVGLPYVNYTACNRVWENSLFQETQICAGGVAGKDSCQGDSGGSLFITSNLDHPTNAKIVGVASFGGICGSTQPAIYSNAVHFIAPWLKEQVDSLDEEENQKQKRQERIEAWINYFKQLGLD